MQTFIQYLKEGVEEHEKLKDHTQNPYHDTLTKHGFQHVSTRHVKSSHDSSGRHDDTEHVYTHPNHGKTHVIVTQEHDATVGHGGQKSKGHHFLHRHEQSNGLMAPGIGDNKNQLHRSLSREYGVPKGMDAPKTMSWEKHHPYQYKMNEAENKPTQPTQHKCFSCGDLIKGRGKTTEKGEHICNDCDKHYAFGGPGEND